MHASNRSTWAVEEEFWKDVRAKKDFNRSVDSKASDRGKYVVPVLVPR